MFAICKPILPLVQDVLAHSFWESKHLATVHHHHGDHHAEEEIAEAEHDEHDEQPVTTKISEPVSVHMAAEILCSFSQPIIHRQKFAVKICNFTSVSLDKHYPPPKFC